MTYTDLAEDPFSSAPFSLPGKQCLMAVEIGDTGHICSVPAFAALMMCSFGILMAADQKYLGQNLL
jgi:hypothetical protein